MIDVAQYRNDAAVARQWRKSPSSRALVGNSEYQSFFLNPLAEGSLDDDQQPIAYAGASVANDGPISHNPLAREYDAREYDEAISTPDSPARSSAFAFAFGCSWGHPAPCPSKPCVVTTSPHDTSTRSPPPRPLTISASTSEPPAAVRLRDSLAHQVRILKALSAEVSDSDTGIPLPLSEPMAPCTPPRAVRETGAVVSPRCSRDCPDVKQPSCRSGLLFSGQAVDRPLTVKVGSLSPLATACGDAVCLWTNDKSGSDCSSPPLPPPPPPSPTSLLVAIRQLTMSYASAGHFAALPPSTLSFDPVPYAVMTPASSTAAARGTAACDEADHITTDPACFITDLATARSAVQQLGLRRSVSARSVPPLAHYLLPPSCRSAAAAVQEAMYGARQLRGRLAIAERAHMQQDEMSCAMQRHQEANEVDGDGEQAHLAGSSHATSVAAAISAVQDARSPRGSENDPGVNNNYYYYDDDESDLASSDGGECTTLGEGPWVIPCHPEGWLEPQKWEPLREKYCGIRQMM